jgi:glycosyltransferase involved in cell wall biosynthesis
MRIACIATSRVPSRTANSIQVMKVCQALVELGHEVRLWLPGTAAGVAWPDLGRHYGLRKPFRITWLRSARILRRYDFCLRAVLRARGWGADLYYVWPYAAAALASRLGLPTALEIHDRPQGRFGPGLVRGFLRGSGARRLLPTTEALRAWLASAYGLTLEGRFVVVTPNGVELERYQGLPSVTQARASLSFPEIFTAGYTGHLYPGRGVDLLLGLARRNPAIRFVLAGGEPAAVERWRGRTAEAGLTNVQLLGFVPNEQLPLVQAACDVLLMPHEWHVSDSGGGDITEFTNPMKMFEYLASGRTILASDLPVLREVLNEGNALLAPPEDADAWDAALRRLAGDPGLRHRLASRARQDAARYTWLERARRAVEGLEGGCRE